MTIDRGCLWRIDFTKLSVVLMCVDVCCVVKWGVAYDRRDNLIWVAEYSNNRIQMFTPDGSFVKSWNKSGTANGELKGPTAIAFGAGPTEDFVFVCEYSNNRVQCFKRDGTYVRQYSQVLDPAVSYTPQKLSGPSSVVVDPEGYLYIAEYAIHPHHSSQICLLIGRSLSVLCVCSVNPIIPFVCSVRMVRMYDRSEPKVRATDNSTIPPV